MSHAALRLMKELLSCHRVKVRVRVRVWVY